MQRSQWQRCGNAPVFFGVAVLWLASLGAIVFVNDERNPRPKVDSSSQQSLRSQLQVLAQKQDDLFQAFTAHQRSANDADAAQKESQIQQALAIRELETSLKAAMQLAGSTAIEAVQTVKLSTVSLRATSPWHSEVQFCPPWPGADASEQQAEGSRAPSSFQSYDALLAESAKAAANQKEMNCTWLKLFSSGVSFRLFPTPVSMCAHDPKVDIVISGGIAGNGAWFPSDWGLKVHSRPTCTPERPFVIDVGVNLGMFSIHPLDAGCVVIGFEPLTWNIAKARQTFERLDLSSLAGRAGTPRSILFKNAVSDVPGRVTIAAALMNPGTSQAAADPVNPDKEAVPSPPAWLPELEGVPEVVDVVTIDELFTDPALDWIVHPTTGERLRPEHVHSMKVDAEGFDLRVANGARRLLAEGQPSWLEWEIPLQASGHFGYLSTRGCNDTLFVDYLYDMGYVYLPNTEKDTAPVTRKELQGIVATGVSYVTSSSLDGSWMHVSELMKRG